MCVSNGQWLTDEVKLDKKQVFRNVHDALIQVIRVYAQLIKEEALKVTIM